MALYEVFRCGVVLIAIGNVQLEIISSGLTFTANAVSIGFAGLLYEPPRYSLIKKLNTTMLKGSKAPLLHQLHQM